MVYIAMGKRSPSIALGATFHDPKGEWIGAFFQGNNPFRKLASHFDGFVVSLSLAMEGRDWIVQVLEKAGIRVVFENSGEQLSSNSVENNHLRAIVEAGKMGTDLVLYADFDRLLADSLPNTNKEFSRFVDRLRGSLKAETSDAQVLTINRRLPLDSVLRETTEMPLLKIISGLVECDVDPLGSYVVFQNEAVGSIVVASRRSPEMTFPATKWVLLAKEMGLRLGNLNSEGQIGRFESPVLLERDKMILRARKYQLEMDDLGSRYGYDLDPSGFHSRAGRSVVKAARSGFTTSPGELNVILAEELLEAETDKWKGKIASTLGILDFIRTEIESARILAGPEIVSQVRDCKAYLDWVNQKLDGERRVLSEEFFRSVSSKAEEQGIPFPYVTVEGRPRISS